MFAYITGIGQCADIIKTIFLSWFCYVILLQPIIFQVTERACVNHDSKRQNPVVFFKINVLSAKIHSICFSFFFAQSAFPVNLYANIVFNSTISMFDNVIIFQSQWKGYLVRRKIKDARLREARERIEAATKKVTESMKLCNRTRSALEYLLKVKNLSTVYEALQQLGKCTCCCCWL